MRVVHLILLDLFAGLRFKKFFLLLVLLVIICLLVLTSTSFINWLKNDTNAYFSLHQSVRHKRAATDEWASWSDWTLCTQTNGVSSQTRSRNCSNANGKCAGGESTQARSCVFSNANENMGKAQSNPATAPQQTPVPSEWRQWSSWSDCNSMRLSAEPPFRSRWRECHPCSTDTTVQCLPCQGASFEQMACQKPAPNTNYINPNLNGEQPFWVASPSLNNPGQPFRPLVQQPSSSCEWGQWGVWSQCTASCGTNSRRYRARSCSCPSRCPGGAPIEDELCAGLPQCNAPATVLSVSPGGETPMQDQPAKQQVLVLSYPCSLCPPQYPLPCYTCIALPNPQAGKKKRK